MAMRLSRYSHIWGRHCENSQWSMPAVRLDEAREFPTAGAAKGGVMVTSPGGIARSENLGTIMPTSI